MLEIGNAMKPVVLLLIAAASLLQPQEITHTTDIRVIHKVVPEYTMEALAAKVEGEVVFSLVVDVDGVPQDIKLLRALGKGLDEKAEEALRQWRFSPATNHGEPVPTKATIEMNFRLSDPSQNRTTSK